MKKYGSLFFALALSVMSVSLVANADIPITHKKTEHSDLKKTLEDNGKATSTGEDSTKLCEGAKLEHCVVGQGCTLTCGTAASTSKKSTTRGTASVKKTTDDSAQ